MDFFVNGIGVECSEAAFDSVCRTAMNNFRGLGVAVGAGKGWFTLYFLFKEIWISGDGSLESGWLQTVFTINL